MSSESDPHVGGSLSDMAVTGTTIPNDAGKQNIIPSVARPDQTRDDPNDMGSRDLAGVADMPTDFPRARLSLPFTVLMCCIINFDLSSNHSQPKTKPP
jgi:hypothetical protein